MRTIDAGRIVEGVLRRDSGSRTMRKLLGKNKSKQMYLQSGSDPDFDISFVQDDDAIAGLLQDWDGLLGASSSPEKIYQTAAFYQYIKETADLAVNPCALLVARRRADGAVIGIVPVRLRRQDLQFRMGRIGAASPGLPVVQLLGSVPMLADQPGLLQAVVERLLEHFPSARAVSLQALPAELIGPFRQLDGMGASVLDGWRDCHTIALPESFDAYLQKFSAKKRYNLARQVRQLAAEAGALEVTLVDRPEHAALLVDAVRALMPPADFAAFPAQHKLERLAARGLLLSCVVRCAGVPVGAVVGSNGIGRWLVHNILSDQKYQHLSAGTSTLHLALKEVMAARAFHEVDFGYGTPNRDFRSTHQLRTRGHVLVYRRAGLTPALLACHGLYGTLYAGLAASVKRLKKQLSAWRARRSRPPEA